MFTEIVTQNLLGFETVFAFLTADSPLLVEAKSLFMRSFLTSIPKKSK